MKNTPVKEAIEIFLEVKNRIDKLAKQLDEKKKDTLKSKLRTRAREIPGMIAELGLIPALSFCLAKAEKEGLQRAFILMERGTESFNLQNVDLDKLAYGIYAYVLLKYLRNHLGQIVIKSERAEEKVELDLEEILEGKIDSICNYLDALLGSGEAVSAVALLRPYLIQFKRLCEAEFPSESRGG